MSNLRQAAELALEIIETHHGEFDYANEITAIRAALEQPSTAVRYSRKELNEFEQMQDGTWEADRNG
jgi:hypothetical protein